MKEKIYLWAHKEGIQNNRWGLPKESKISPAEACRYLGIENIIFVREFGKPAPEEYEKYADSFRNLSKVIWSVVGAGCSYEEEDITRVLELKKKYKNITGAIMDDFFAKGEKLLFTPRQITEIKEKLHGSSLDLWVVLYQHQLDLPVREYLERFDLITYWVWKSEGIKELEKCFDRFCEIVPEKRKVLGIYMWDYGNANRMSFDLFKKECEIGFKWLKEGRIEGIIFLASCIVDLGLNSVEYVKRVMADMNNA